MLYAASPVKRARRTQTEIDAIKSVMVDILAAGQPMTLRGLFYQMVGTGMIPKTEAGYGRVGAYLLALRRSGAVPYDWVADNTRWQRKPRTFSGLEAALYETAHAYRRQLWRDQSCYVEIWLEKDTLAGVLYEVTEQMDVPLMVTRGYASETYLHGAAQAIAAQRKPAYLYVLTDYDRAGHDIATQIERRMAGFLEDHDQPVTVERIAVTPQQIQEMSLPTRPPKRKGDPDECVELDAIPADDLRKMVSAAISQHIDERQMAETLAIETHERAIVADLVRGWAA
jgi:hypothetical protein